MRSPHQTLRRVLLAACGLAVALTSLPAAAQWTEAVAADATSASAVNDRDREFAALSHDVDALDHEFGLIKRVVKLVSPTVVHIEAALQPKFRQLQNIEEAGSGIIVQFGNDFYVITNRHVIRHSAQDLVSIHLADGRVITPEKVWSDKDTDVAIMATHAPNLTPAKLGNSDNLEIGECVLAIGSPFGLSQSVTRGIISAKGRHNLDLGDGELRFQNFIQTDAAINPGNSGGPLMNLRGEVVGLNTAIASSSGGNEGIGFSIPINIVARTARQLVENNQVARGYLGVKLDSKFDEKQAKALGLSRLAGTRITLIEPKSPAEKAEFKVNDVILEYNNVRVEDGDHLISLVKLTEVGQQVPLVIYRDGHALRANVLIGDMRDYSGTDQ